MKTYLSLFALAAALSTTPAYASVLDAEQDTVEVANALYNCASAVAPFAKDGGDQILAVETAFRQISNRVSKKVYYFRTGSGGGFRPPSEGASLRAELTLTMPPVGTNDMPAREQWKCSIVLK